VLTAIGDLTQCILLLTATIFIAWNITKGDRRAKFFWTLMALGFAAWFCSQVLWTYFEVVLRKETPNPFVGDVILFLHIVPMMAALAIQPHMRQDRHLARLGLLDVVLLLVGWLYLYLFLVIPWQYVYPNEAIYGHNFNILYLCEHLVFLLGVVLVSQRSAGPWKIIYTQFFGAAALYALGSIAAGVAIDFINIPAQTAVQEYTPERLKGRVLALQLMLYNALSIPVILFIGGIADTLGLPIVIYLVAASIIAFGLWGRYYENKHKHSFTGDLHEETAELTEPERVSR